MYIHDKLAQLTYYTNNHKNKKLKMYMAHFEVGGLKQMIFYFFFIHLIFAFIPNLGN